MHDSAVKAVEFFSFMYFSFHLQCIEMEYLWMIFQISFRKVLPVKGIDWLIGPGFNYLKNLYCGVLIFYQLPYVAQGFHILSAAFVSKSMNLPIGYGHSLPY